MNEKKRILVVDDEESMIRIIGIKLRISGYEVIAVNDGHQALHIVEHNCPDIMLLDIMMPGMDGFDVLRKMKYLPYVPVIALSARQENREKSLALGAETFITKPFNIDQLVTEIKTVLDHNDKR